MSVLWGIPTISHEKIMVEKPPRDISLPKIPNDGSAYPIPCSCFPLAARQTVCVCAINMVRQNLKVTCIAFSGSVIQPQLTDTVASLAAVGISAD